MTTHLPTVPVMVVSHHRRKFLMSSVMENVNMMKYMPLNLSVRRPMHKARMKLRRLASRITTGRGSALPNKAEVYTPTPKKAADAREMYREGPEKIAQLTVMTIYMKIVVDNTTRYGGKKRGSVDNRTKTSAINPSMRGFPE